MRGMERLLATLFPANGPKLVDLKFFPSDRKVTVDEFCDDAHACFLQVDLGLTKASKDFAEDLRPVSVERFLADA